MLYSLEVLNTFLSFPLTSGKVRVTQHLQKTSIKTCICLCTYTCEVRSLIHANLWIMWWQYFNLFSTNQYKSISTGNASFKWNHRSLLQNVKEKKMLPYRAVSVLATLNSLSWSQPLSISFLPPRFLFYFFFNKMWSKIRTLFPIQCFVAVMGKKKYKGWKSGYLLKHKFKNVSKGNFILKKSISPHF